MSSSKPFVSVVTPTYNRHKFLPTLIYQFQYQKYDKELMELIIIDDSPTRWPDTDGLLEKDPRIRYIYLDTGKIKLATKRNMLLKEAKGDIVLAMDDDDFYFPTYVKASVSAHTRVAPNNMVSGCTELLIYDVKDGSGYMVGPYNKNSHTTNASMGVKRSYIKNHSYDEETLKTTGEEKHFLDDFSTRVTQLSPYDTLICFNHGSNTFDKGMLLKNDKKKHFKLKDLIKDKKLLKFWSSLTVESTPEIRAQQAAAIEYTMKEIEQQRLRQLQQQQQQSEKQQQQ